MNNMTIGKLAKRVGLGIETVRFYERQGLIDPPARTESNYRIYPAEEIKRLRFIKRAKTLGFTLHEIKELMTLRNNPHATKADIKKQTRIKIDDVKQKINDLKKIKDALEHLHNSCDGHGSLDDCPILEALDSDENHCGH